MTSTRYQLTPVHSRKNITLAGGALPGRSPTEREVDSTVIPYCVWDNRAPGEMRVWLRARNR